MKTQRKRGIRPRLTFNSIKEQIGDYCKLIYSGKINDLYKKE